MTQTATAITTLSDSAEAARELARGVRTAFAGAPADALIVFASARHDAGVLLPTLARECGTEVIAGASSAGEFTHVSRGEGAVSVLALRSPEMQFSVALARELSVDPCAAAQSLTSTFNGLADGALPYRSALVMTDALMGHADALVEHLTLATGGNYRFFGGGAGDDGRFETTFVFAGTEAAQDAAVALEILSAQPVGIGVSHGWVPAGDGMRVTEVDGSRLISLNGEPAAQAFIDHAAATGQPLDRSQPLPFLLHNILGIKDDSGYRLRVPLAMNGDGSVACAANVPHGAIVHLMKTTDASAVAAAERATRAALDALEGRAPGAALVFDCVATRMRLGRGFDDELAACANLLRPAGFVGCNTYGQIARAEGQFAGFHNCTAVVCVLPA